MIRLVWKLACKDWKVFATDRQAVLLSFAVPILLASVFGAVFHRPGANNSEDRRLPVLVVVEDEAPLTRRVVAALLNSDKVEARVTDRATALRRVERRRGGIALVLPAGFGRLGQFGGRVPRVTLLHPPNLEYEGRWAEGVLTEVVMRELAADLLARLPVPLERFSWKRPFELERAAVPALPSIANNAYAHSFCGMTIQYLLFWGMDSGLLLLRERQRGLWRRFRAAPVGRTTLLLSRLLATAGVALAQILVTFAFAFIVFGVRISGSPAGFAVMAVCLAVLSAATGLLIAAVGGTEARARSVSILTILALAMLGGLWLPSFLLPRWMQTLSQALPTTWAARGLEGVTWQGMGLSDAVACGLVVLGFSAAFLLAALLRFARVERG